jgi:hypothetical protein
MVASRDEYGSSEAASNTGRSPGEPSAVAVDTLLAPQLEANKARQTAIARDGYVQGNFILDSR